MKRRDFVAGLGLLAAAPTALAADKKDAEEEDRQYLEWIHYSLPGRRDRRVESYYEDAAIPALNRLRITDIGV